MFRKILFLLLLSSTGLLAQSNGEASCFDVKVVEADLKDLGYYVEDTDKYVVCRDQKVKIPATLNAPLRRSNTYQVSRLPYAAYPTTGIDVDVPTVDAWSPNTIDLPFAFCFFDKPWKKIHVHGNGWITFTDGLFKPNTPIGGNDPSSALPTTDPAMLNSVLFQRHLHYSNSSPGFLRYAVYGTAPCRVFVITWGDMLPYQLTPALCSFALPQTHQIVLHETTNFVDIISVHYELCPPFANEGNAVMGINNATGTLGYAPPGRNLGLFDAVKEAWRFSPNGEALFRIEWEVDGDLVQADDDFLEVTINKKKEVKVKLIAETCQEEFTASHTIYFRPAIEIDKVKLEDIVCDKNQNEYNLNIITQMIKDGQSGTQEEINRIKFIYYPTEDDANNKTNQISNPQKYPIKGGVDDPVKNILYVRVEAEIADCYEILPVTIVKAPVEVLDKNDINLCEKFTFPTLTNDEFYYKLERLDEDAKFVVETLPVPLENEVLERIGYYRVFVKKINDYGCENVKSYILFVENCSFPKGISPNGDGNNDYLDLTYNNVRELKIYNRYGKLVYEFQGKGYKRQWVGQDLSGKKLPTGTYFVYVKTKDSEYQDWIQLVNEVKK